MKLYSRATILVVLGFACPASLPAWVGAEDRPSTRAGADLVCGPRCVGFLLRHYGKPEESLYDLTREIQWPDLESGASLDSLKQALLKRGIYAEAVAASPDRDLRWPHPVLLHLTGETAGGHYVVWLPGGPPETSTVWLGLEGIRTGPTAKLARHRSGTVLLYFTRP